MLKVRGVCVWCVGSCLGAFGQSGSVRQALFGQVWELWKYKAVWALGELERTGRTFDSHMPTARGVGRVFWRALAFGIVLEPFGSFLSHLQGLGGREHV